MLSFELSYSFRLDKSCKPQQQSLWEQADCLSSDNAPFRIIKTNFLHIFLVKYKHINTSSLNLYSIFLHFLGGPGSLFFWIYWSKTPSHLCPTKSLRGLSFPILRVLPSSPWLIAFAALMLSWEAGLAYVQTLLVPCWGCLWQSRRFCLYLRVVTNYLLTPQHLLERKPNRIQCLKGKGKVRRGKNRPGTNPVFCSWEGNPHIEDFVLILRAVLKERKDHK